MVKTKLAERPLCSGRVTDPAQKENLGIIVQYKVKVKLIVSMGGDLSVELPFTLTHPKPDPLILAKLESKPSAQIAAKSVDRKPEEAGVNGGSGAGEAVDLNLIQFETR